MVSVLHVSGGNLLGLQDRGALAVPAELRVRPLERKVPIWAARCPALCGL